MRIAAAVVAVGLTGCATDQPPDPPAPATEPDYAAKIHTGDVIVLVPGTGSLDYLGTPIEKMAVDQASSTPLVDPKLSHEVASDSVVFEQAIAAAHRAGITEDEMESGAVVFGIWGAGFTHVEEFTYLSYEGIHVPVKVIGGQNSCATGLIFENIINYTTQSADKDAADLYTRTQAFLKAHPVAAPRNVIVASHSWGGAVAEYLNFKLPDYESKLGPLADGGGVAKMALTLADGVPDMIAVMNMAGPGMHQGNETLVYEVDRPDDPVHTLNTHGNGDGHMYTIIIGDEFIGSYGITTNELACAGIAGECQAPPPE